MRDTSSSEVEIEYIDNATVSQSKAELQIIKDDEQSESVRLCYLPDKNN